MNKQCAKCKIEKPVSEFYKKSFVPKTGSPRLDGYFSSRCKSCMSQKYKEQWKNPNIRDKKMKQMKQRYENNKQEYKDRVTDRMKLRLDYVINYLNDHSCVDCGESDIVVLQFDHKDSTQKVSTVSRMINKSYSFDLLKNEIEKCEVRCANCHTRRTAKQFNWLRLQY